MRIQSLIYRIELPCTNEEDIAQVEEFKRVLDKVLQFEKTACPFQREFEDDVQLEDPDEYIRRGTYGPTGRARKWEFDEIWRPEGAEKEVPVKQQLRHIHRESYGDDEVDSSTPSSPSLSMTSAGAEEHKVFLRPKTIDKMRRVTAPPQLSLVNAAPNPRSSDSPPLETPDETTATNPLQIFNGPELLSASLVTPSSVVELDSPTEPSASNTTSPTRTTSTTATSPPILPSFSPLSSPRQRRSPQHSPLHSISEHFIPALPSYPTTPTLSTTSPRLQQKPTTTSLSTSSSSTTTTSTTPPTPLPLSTATPTLAPTQTTHASPTAHLTRHRAGSASSSLSRSHSRRRSSGSSNLPRTSSTSSFSNANRQTTATTFLISRTCALLLGPPSNLVALMYEIARQVTRSRAYRLFVRSDGEGGTGGVDTSGLRVPGGWADSEDEEAVEGEGEAEVEAEVGEGEVDVLLSVDGEGNVESTGRGSDEEEATRRRAWGRLEAD